MTDEIRKTVYDSLCQFLIDNGKTIIDLTNPFSACKLALETLEENNRDRFIEEVLNGLNNVDIESLKAEKSLERLYKSLQVIVKATTQDKINRFKKLTINGIIYQNELSEDDFDIYKDIIDSLTDVEFVILSKINNKYKAVMNKTVNEQLSNQLGNELLNDLNIDIETFESYVERLKGKGLIINDDRVMTSWTDSFIINIVGGRISVLANNLIEFLHKEII